MENLDRIIDDVRREISLIEELGRAMDNEASTRAIEALDGTFGMTEDLDEETEKMRQKRKMRRRKRRRGIVATEFALILPVAVLLFTGAINVGWAMSRHNQCSAVAAAFTTAIARGASETEAALSVEALANSVDADVELSADASAVVVTSSPKIFWPLDVRVELALPQPVVMP